MCIFPYLSILHFCSSVLPTQKQHLYLKFSMIQHTNFELSQTQLPASVPLITRVAFWGYEPQCVVLNTGTWRTWMIEDSIGISAHLFVFVTCGSWDVKTRDHRNGDPHGETHYNFNTVVRLPHRKKMVMEQKLPRVDRVICVAKWGQNIPGRGIARAKPQSWQCDGCVDGLASRPAWLQLVRKEES